MKKSLMPLAAITFSIMITVPTFANHIYAGEEVEKVVTYDENGNKVITLIFDPAKHPTL